MSWNIELACLRGARSLSDVVPDVFAETKQRLGFEDATSSTRGPDLCVARLAKTSAASSGPTTREGDMTWSRSR